MAVGVAAQVARPADAGASTSPYARWKNGPSTSPDYFPLAVWLQNPADAGQWKKAGINLYIGLWDGPTLKQLDALRAAGMQTICDQNAVALSYHKTLDDGRPVIVGWLLPDEPDNAQPDGKNGYGPPIPTSKIQAMAANFRAHDATRPVFLGMGMGMAMDAMTWVGQGGKIVPERDYPQYLKACDIAAYDVYPVASDSPDLHNKLWRVPLGVDRLKHFAPAGTIIWNDLETGDIGAKGPKYTPSPEQIKAEAWMSIIHGSRGIDYFIHGKSNTAKFDASALLEPENAVRLKAVTQINHQVLKLASVINSPALPVGAVRVLHHTGETAVDFMARRHDGSLYIFAVAMRDEPANKTFVIGEPVNGQVEVIGEKRTVPLKNGQFTDQFDGYGVHLYRIGK